MEEQQATVQEQATGQHAPANRKAEKAWKVFLAWAPEDVAEIREQLKVMLQKAGLDVYPKEEFPDPSTDEPGFRKFVNETLPKVDCSIHILGGAYGPTLKSQAELSLSKYQYLSASKTEKAEGAKFKRLVWTYPTKGMILEGEQQQYINEIQNTISEDIMLTNVASPQRFIEDGLTFLAKSEEKAEIPKEYDIAFISNVQDAAECYETIEKLGEEAKVQTLTIVPEKEIDYREEASDIILKSRMVVIFFKEASDWAVAFAKQIWKEIGGVSAGIPFLLVGENEPRRNRFINFKAPQVETYVVQPDQILLTIQDNYRRVAETGKINEDIFCPYTGLRPFNEDESIFFRGREKHIDQIIDIIRDQKFAMVTGSSGDGKSSLIYAGVIPNLKGGFLRTQFSKWAVADFRPERSPLRNLSESVSQQLRLRDPDNVENTLSYGFSALVDLYKESDLYCDTTSQEWMDGDEEKRKAMKRQAANLLILVDQFEEFFTNVENYRDGVASPVAQITVNVLLETIRIAREEELPIYVVFTMRSDYIGQCVAFRGFAEMIGLSTYFVPRLKREEIQEVIESPAKLNGNKISMRLTQRILNDLGDGVDQLPVLQHTLYQVWSDADKGQKELDLLNYAKVGGLAPSKLPPEDKITFKHWLKDQSEDIQKLYEKPKLRNVLNRHANELFLTAHRYYNKNRGADRPELTEEEAQEILRIAFTGLTKIDENRAVRNRMSLEEVSQLIGNPDYDFAAVNGVLNIFREEGNTFVQPYIFEADDRDLAPNTVLDITHEALIRNWDRLIQWAETEYRSVQIYSDFKIQVNRWLAEDCSPKYLLTSGTYNYFNDWYERQQPTPAWIRRYIEPDEIIPELDPMEQATQYLEDIEEFLALSRQRIERNRRLVMFVIGLISVLFIFSLIAAYIANQQRAEAERQKQIALENEREANEQRILAENSALEAQNARRRAELEAMRAEQQAIIAENQRRIAVGAKIEADRQRRLAELQAQIAEKERRIAEDQRQIAIMQRQRAEDATLDALRSQKLAELEAQRARVQRNNAYTLFNLFMASQAEEQVADDPELAINIALKGLPQNLGQPDRPYVSEAEASLYLAADAIVNADPLAALQGHKNQVVFNRFSPDGNRLITTSWDMSARVWDVNTGRQISVLRGHTHIVDQAYFSQDGNLIVTLAEDFTARMWDFRSKSETEVFRGHENLLTHAAFSPDNSLVATGSIDNTARIWDARSGEQLAVLPNHSDDVVHVAFSPNSGYVVTSSKDRTARVWDASNGALLATLAGHRGEVNYAEFSPNGRYIVTVSDDRTARLWDVSTGEEVHTMVGHRDVVNHAAFSHDGRKIVTTSRDRTARVWDVSSGQQYDVLRGHTDNVYHAVFSPNDKRLATTSDDGTVRLWDANSYLRLAEYDGHPGGGYHAAFSPDSRKIAVATGRKTIEILQVLPDRQALINFAKNNLDTRDMTPQEKKDFFLTDPRLQREIDADAYIEQMEEEIARERKRMENQQMEQARQEGEGSEVAPENRDGSNANQSNNGQRSGRYHVVQPGETIWRIARMYNIKPDQLRKWNNITGNRITEGQSIRVAP